MRARSICVGANTTFKSPSPTRWPGSRMIGKEGRPDSAKSPASAPPITMLAMTRLQLPLLEIGKGSRLWQAPTLWMTSGAKARSGGTSICGQGVLAVTVRVLVREAGSSLTMTRVQLLGPQEVGVRRITTFRQESGLTVAGNGLLIKVKSGQGGTKERLLTWRSHDPTLQRERVFSASVPAQTSPKSAEPVMRIAPVGASPATLTIALGRFGSLLVIAMVLSFMPGLVG